VEADLLAYDGRLEELNWLGQFDAREPPLGNELPPRVRYFCREFDRREPPTWATDFFPKREHWPDFAGAPLLGTEHPAEADELGVFGPIAIYVQSAVRYIRLMLAQGVSLGRVEIFDLLAGYTWPRFLDPEWLQPLPNQDARYGCLRRLCRLIWGLVENGRTYESSSPHLPRPLRYLLFNLEDLVPALTEDFIWQCQDDHQPPLRPDLYQSMRGVFWAERHGRLCQQQAALPPPQNTIYISPVKPEVEGVVQHRSVGVQALAGSGVALPHRFIGRNHQVQRDLDLGLPPPDEPPRVTLENLDYRFPEISHVLETAQPVPPARRPPAGPPTTPVYCDELQREREKAEAEDEASASVAMTLSDASAPNPFDCASDDEVPDLESEDLVMTESHLEGFSSEGSEDITLLPPNRRRRRSSDSVEMEVTRL
jgi:hypothetical protein